MKDIKLTNANSQGIVEHGFIEIAIPDGDNIIDSGTRSISITLQQYSTGINKYLLDDVEYKTHLEELGVEFEGTEEIVGPDQFLTDLFDYYADNSRIW
jgi:hypothetical protein